MNKTLKVQILKTKVLKHDQIWYGIQECYEALTFRPEFSCLFCILRWFTNSEQIIIIIITNKYQQGFQNLSKLTSFDAPLNIWKDLTSFKLSGSAFQRIDPRNTNDSIPKRLVFAFSIVRRLFCPSVIRKSFLFEQFVQDRRT